MPRKLDVGVLDWALGRPLSRRLAVMEITGTRALRTTAAQMLDGDNGDALGWLQENCPCMELDEDDAPEWAADLKPLYDEAAAILAAVSMVGRAADVQPGDAALQTQADLEDVLAVLPFDGDWQVNQVALCRAALDAAADCRELLEARFDGTAQEFAVHLRKLQMSDKAGQASRNAMERSFAAAFQPVRDFHAEVRRAAHLPMAFRPVLSVFHRYASGEFIGKLAKLGGFHR